MFGKMSLLMGCRSGMTVKFASKFHHGNPFVRGLLFVDGAAPFRGGRALRCSTLVRYRVRVVSLAGALRSMRVCVTPPLQERYRHVRRRAAVVRGSYESDFLRWSPHCRAEELLRRRSEAMRSARVVRRPAKAGSFGAHLRSTVHCSPCAPRRAKGAGKLHRFATLAPHSPLCTCLFARRYSSTSRHSKRVDARFAKRTVYRPPSGELVMVLIR